MDYKNAGVDIEAGYKSVELMKKHIQQTMRPEVLTNIGGFSGAFSMEKFKDMEKPTLVSGTDGVGCDLPAEEDQTSSDGRISWMPDIQRHVYAALSGSLCV